MIGNQLRILEALESGVQRAHEIAVVASVPLPQVWARLHEFKRMGLVRAIRLRTNRRDRGEKYKRYLLIRISA